MNKMKFIFKIVFVMLIVWAIAAGAYAATQESVGTIKVECSYNDEPVSSIPFSLYHAGDVSGSKITLDSKFSAFPVNFQSLDVDSLNKLALTIKGYVVAASIVPDATGISDDNGVLTFDGLSAGLYLVVGKGAAVDQMYYSSVPFFVLIPTTKPESGEMIYNQTVFPKFARSQDVDLTLTRKVIKSWKDIDEDIDEDIDYETERPSEVTIRLYCDGLEYDSVKLSDTNSWQYTWEGLPAEHDYVVVEDEEIGYTVDIEREGVTFKVTNTPVKILPPIRPDNPPDDSPDNSSHTTSDEPGSNNSNSPSANKLPATGLNWWPVLICAILGLLCLATGVLWQKGSIHEEEK